jgi:hypothetical protein
MDALFIKMKPNSTDVLANRAIKRSLTRCHRKLPITNLIRNITKFRQISIGCGVQFRAQPPFSSFGYEVPFAHNPLFFFFSLAYFSLFFLFFFGSKGRFGHNPLLSFFFFSLFLCNIIQVQVIRLKKARHGFIIKTEATQEFKARK